MKIPCLATLACCGACATPAPTRRPQIGVTTTYVADPAEPGTTYAVEIWYPAKAPPDAPHDVVLGIEGRAVRDAPADAAGGPFPVIGFSHGASGIRFQSIYLTEELASHGYVVVAPDHHHDTFFDEDAALRAKVLVRRPHAVREAIDLVLARSADADDALAGLADPSRIGVAGHSFGAFTALVLAGARIDLTAVRAACQARPDDRVCQALDGTLSQADLDDLADPRVAAAVALAPGGQVAFGDAGLASATAPISIQAGTLDTFCPLATEAQPIADRLVTDHELVVIDRAAHFSFTDICPLYELLGGDMGELAFLGSEGCGANTAAPADVHVISQTSAVAFFDRHLASSF